MQIFIVVGFVVQPEEEEDEEHGNSVKIKITCITPVLRVFLDFFSDIISFQHVPHFGIGISQIEWKLKVKTDISVFPWAKIGKNDHSNPYIESTTVLSDTALGYASLLYLLSRPHPSYNYIAFITLFQTTTITNSMYFGEPYQNIS